MNANSFVEVLPGGPVTGSIRPPGSKSLTNRALLCAAFARSPSVLRGALASDDTHVMIDSLRRIGITVRSELGDETLHVDGIASPTHPAGRAGPIELFIGNSGTTIRFLTAALSAFGGEYRLSGVDRMHERPIGDLVQAITPVCDGTVQCQSAGECPPVSIRSRGWRSGEVRVAGNVSSQFLSGLMMAAPIADRHVRVHVVGELVSRPYVAMTATIMRDFGAGVQWNDEPSDSSSPLVFDIDGTSGYAGREYKIEPDASAASYFWAAAAITGGTVTIDGLSPGAMQGDVGFVEALRRMGCEVTATDDSITVTGSSRLRGVDIDMNGISDTTQTLAVVALFAEGPTRIRGVAHNRFKETDRIGDLACELRKLGAVIDEHDDGLTIHPLLNVRDRTGATLDTYDDHRMAMSLSLAGLRIPGVKIANPACTAKTYPGYFADLERLIGRAHHWSTPDWPVPAVGVT